MFGMNAFGTQWCGHIFTLHFTSLKMAVLLHKTALVNFPMATTVKCITQIVTNEYSNLLTLKADVFSIGIEMLLQ